MDEKKVSLKASNIIFDAFKIKEYSIYILKNKSVKI